MKKLYLFFAFFSLASLSIFGQSSSELSPNAVVFPRYPNNSRPTGNIPIGATIFNVSQNVHQYYTGSTWVNLAPGGSGVSPWLLNGNMVYINNNNKVGINTENAGATLDIVGEDIRLNGNYYINPNPTSSTYTMLPTVNPNGSIPYLYDQSARILDPSGTENTSQNEIRSIVQLGIFSNEGRQTYGINFTFESIDIGDANTDPYSYNKIIFSSSKDISINEDKILTINRYNASQYLGRTFFLSSSEVYVHFIKESGSVPGFQLLYQGVFSTNSDIYPNFYTENINGGFYYNSSRNNFAVGINARATGNSSLAMGPGTKAMADNTVAIGSQVKAVGSGSIAIGGTSRAYGSGSIAIGGTANGNLSMALGSGSTANQNYSMALSGYSVSTGSAYELATGFRSYRFYTKDDKSTYVMLNEGQGSWSGTSDSTKKERFRPVKGEDILAKVSKMKLTSWNFKNSTQRHYGPMAQDFFAAFGKDELGTIGNDTTINSGDFDGINLIAIQALEKRTKEYEAQNNKLKVEIAELKQALADLNRNQALLLENFKELQASLSIQKKEDKSKNEAKK